MSWVSPPTQCPRGTELQSRVQLDMTSAGRKVLLGTVGEEEFARAVKRWADRAGWCGYHVRYSVTAVEGIHTLHNSDHSDAHGMPDWILAKPGQPLWMPELKTVIGRVRKDQDRWIELLDSTTGVRSGVWRPDMEEEIRRELEAA